MESKYRDKIKALGGDDYKKPPRMKTLKYEALRRRCWDYDSKFESAVVKELLEWYPKKHDEILRLL